MRSKERPWAKRIDSGGLFVVHWTIPQANPLEEFLHIWESAKYGQIRTMICGERITVDQTLIVKQFGINAEGTKDATNALVKEVQMAFKNMVGLDAFVNKE
jgi:hypothetical protein